MIKAIDFENELEKNIFIEKQNLKEKNTRIWKKIQEIEKVEKYSHKLKNEMCKKNIEISSLARKTEIQNESQIPITNINY